MLRERVASSRPTFGFASSRGRAPHQLPGVRPTRLRVAAKHLGEFRDAAFVVELHRRCPRAVALDGLLDSEVSVRHRGDLRQMGDAHDLP